MDCVYRLAVLSLCIGASVPVPIEQEGGLMFFTDDGPPGNIDERGPYVGGDMVIPREQLMESRAGILGSRYRWAKGRIPYVIDSKFTSSERSTIMNAFNEIQSKTCIRFVKRGSQKDYITIVRGKANSGCWSNIGRQGGKQDVNIQPGNPGCVYKGIIAHELIHAIGYFHEQSRTDRDKYVTIHWDNIIKGTESNFEKLSSNLISPFGVSYDYGSIMHYSADAFSKNRKLTITPKQSDVSANSLGQRRRLSTKDAKKINNMYRGIC